MPSSSKILLFFSCPCTQDVLPELPHHFNQTDRVETNALYLQAVKHVLKLKSLITNNNMEANDSSVLFVDPNMQLVLDRVMEDACSWVRNIENDPPCVVTTVIN